LTLYRYLGTELALALALLGEVAEARAALERVEQTATWASARDVELPVVRAWLCVAEGDLPGARDHLLAAVELARRQHALTSGTSAAHDLARIGYPGPALEVMQMWVPQIDGELAAARLRHVAALVAADAEQLLAASEGFEHLGATLLAAEAAADAATQLLRAGAHRPATAASRRAHELARACPGVRTPALRALDARAELTRSEREIALLAATGQSNREIADKLVLSIRTVENTLQRVYQKLGVAGRRDLAGVLLE
jgi:DNA-binding CsgD family transcriptional regulator